MNITLVCEDSFDGILSAIYDAFLLEKKGNVVNILPGKEYELSFFSKFVEIDTVKDKVSYMIDSINSKISNKAYSMVFKACMHYDKNRADKVYAFLKKGYKYGARITDMLKDESVTNVVDLSKKASNEAHLFKGFIRFSQLDCGLLYGKIEPKCDVLPLMYMHFEKRFPNENWIIDDKTHQSAAVHPKNKDTILTKGFDIESYLKTLGQNSTYEDLWRVFFTHTSIPQRYNTSGQRNMLPLWYRKNMPEFF